MNKEEIPNYHLVDCCELCKYYKEVRHEASIFAYEGQEWEWIPTCLKYDCEISVNAICNSFEKSEVEHQIIL